MDPLRLATFRYDEVDRLRACRLDVRPCRIEVRVIRDDLARSCDHGEEDSLCSAALVRRDHMTERKETLHRIEEAEPGWRPGVALVAVLDRRPLIPRHRARA